MKQLDVVTLSNNRWPCNCQINNLMNFLFDHKFKVGRSMVLLQYVNIYYFYQIFRSKI